MFGLYRRWAARKRAGFVSRDTLVARNGLSDCLSIRDQVSVARIIWPFVATVAWFAVATFLYASISAARAGSLQCADNDPAGSCLDEVQNDPLGELGTRIPLILIHGWHGSTADWDNFVSYVYNPPDGNNLNQRFKLYEFYYTSDVDDLIQLGTALRDALDKENETDSSGFGSKTSIAIVAHSMGGLVARYFMTLVQNQGILASHKGGDRVAKLVTLGTPHHGTQIANETFFPTTPLLSWTTQAYLSAFVVTYGHLPPVSEPNLIDLQWDNYDLSFSNGEQNVEITYINGDEEYDSKIVAYYGDITNLLTDPLAEEPLILYTGAWLLTLGFAVPSDGVVPIESADFDEHPSVKTRPFPNYNHYELVQGKSYQVDTSLFGSINNDLLINTSTAYSDLVPKNIQLSSTNLSPGQSFTVNWNLVNQGAVAANSTSTTVVRINQSTTSAAPINNLASVPTEALAAQQSQPQNAPLTAPITQGTYYVWVIADDFGNVTNQGPYTGNDLLPSAAFLVTAPATPLIVTGIASTYSTTASPYRPTIQLSGSGFSSVNQISWQCTMPGGTSCGYIAPWTSANWTGKFVPTSDTAASISPELLAPGDPAGIYNWTVTFSTGPAEGQSSTVAFNVSFNQQGTYATTTALSVAPSQSVEGQPVTLTANVTSSGGVPPGIVTFYDGTSELGTGSLSNGTANLSTTSLAVATHTITANYSGASGFSASPSNSATVTVAPQSTQQLIVTPGSAAVSGPYGGPFQSFSFQVSASSGSTNFFVDQVPYWLDASPASGTASSTPTTINFTPNSYYANGIPPGTYTYQVLFSMNGGGVGSVFRTITLTVTTPPQGELVVTPNTGVTSSGDLGGPFSPTSFGYFINSTVGTVKYNVSASPGFFDVSPASGIVGTSPIEITVSVDPSEVSTPPGTYTTTITFTNQNDGTTQTRNAYLVVNPLPALQVSPTTNMQWSGQKGGPFSPSSFQYLVSSDKESVHFTISNLPAWLSVSPQSGTVFTSPTPVTFTLNSAANALPADGYTATVVFGNDTNGSFGPGSQNIFATLNVQGSTNGPSFQGLGFMPGGGYGWAYGVSSDGTVPVGFSSTSGNGWEAVTWNLTNGITGLGILPGRTGSEAFAANSNGSVVVGDSWGTGDGNKFEAFSWTNSVMTPLPYLLQTDTDARALGVNFDGSVVVGTEWNSASASGQEAIRWVNGTASGLGFLPGDNISEAYGVSADGSTVVGFSCNSNNCGGTGSTTHEAFRWINGVMSGLGFLPGGDASVANAVNADGSVVVGTSFDATNNQRAFRWTASDGMSDLGVAASLGTAATAVNANGSVIVGNGPFSNGEFGAFRWTPVGGAKSVEDLLTAAGVNFTGWTLNTATGVSADGSVIVGQGTDPFGYTEGWMARLPVAPSALHASDTHDFNADGTSDILWRQSGSGVLAMWLMNGGQNAGTILSGAGFGPVAQSWSVVGTRDFTGNGNADILWQDTSGDLVVWVMNSSTLSSGVNLGNVGTQWQVAGTGDFNGDGVGDILLRNSSTGDLLIWFMSNGQFLSGDNLGQIGTVWSVAGTGDFNGDGITDILLRDSSTGVMVIWLMSNGQILSGVNLGQIPLTWSVVGTGDFNGDGATDILWRDSSGDLAMWLMSNGQISSGASLGQIPLAWSVAETGDFNGDGKSDILWTDTSGDLAVWLMNGTALSSGVGLGNVGTSWQVQGQSAD